MNPELAEKFGMGGDVKAKKSGNICRGRGIARPGTGFTREYRNTSRCYSY